MGKDFQIHSSTQTFKKGRSQFYSLPRMFRRDLMDSVDRSTVESSSERVSQPVNMLEAIEKVGGRWDLVKDLESLYCRTGRGWPNGVERVFYGCHICSGQKRGLCVGKTKKGKGTKLMVVADGQGLPVGERVFSASPHECKLAEETVEEVTMGFPERIVADRAYDSDPLRIRFMEMGIDLICPHRRSRKKPPIQDGRPLRRYKRRWKIERLFAWLGNYRRLVVRWDFNPSMYRAFLHVAFIMIFVKQL